MKTETNKESKDDIQNDVFVIKKPRASLSALTLSNRTQILVDQILSLDKNRHLIFETWGLKDILPHSKKLVVNLFGPSGTGKTHIAEALAGALNMDYMSINYATLESKFVGETAKNISKAFKIASQGNILMHWDESDTILGKRLTNVSQSADHAVNTSRTTMLIELEKFNGPVVFCTNLISNYDSAFERRIDFFIETKLPDIFERVNLLKNLLPKSLPMQSSFSIEDLASQTDGFSPADFKKLVLISAIKMANSSESRFLTNQLTLEATTEILCGKKAIEKKIITTTIEEVSEIP